MFTHNTTRHTGQTENRKPITYCAWVSLLLLYYYYTLSFLRIKHVGCGFWFWKSYKRSRHFWLHSGDDVNPYYVYPDNYMMTLNFYIANSQINNPRYHSGDIKWWLNILRFTKALSSEHHNGIQTNNPWVYIYKYVNKSFDSDPGGNM